MDQCSALNGEVDWTVLMQEERSNDSASDSYETFNESDDAAAEAAWTDVSAAQQAKKAARVERRAERAHRRRVQEERRQKQAATKQLAEAVRSCQQPVYDAVSQHDSELSCFFCFALCSCCVLLTFANRYAYQIQRAHGDVSKAARCMLSARAKALEAQGFRLLRSAPIALRSAPLPDEVDERIECIETIPFANADDDYSLVYARLEAANV